MQHGVLELTFADGLSGEVNVIDRMHGPVFEAARTPEGFAKARSILRPEPWYGRAAPTSRPTRSMSAFALAPGQSRPGFAGCYQLSYQSPPVRAEIWSSHAGRDLTKALKRAADVSKIPAIWLVYAACDRPATSGATRFCTLDGSLDS